MAANYWDHLTGHREALRGSITIYEYERGLLYVRGRFEGVLDPGHYHIWPFTYQRIVAVDLRRTSIQIVNQKLLTADQIAVTLNLAADYQISDLTAAMHRVADYHAQLYQDIQLAARNTVGATAVDDLLQQRAETNGQILEAIRPLASAYGLDVLQVSVKDVILPPNVRDLLMKEVEAQRLAQARLAGAREEIATLRALRNAARLLDEHPNLLPLRQLELLQTFVQTPGNTLVLGAGGTLPLRPGAPPPEGEEA